jgi:hypothetical protein
MARNVLAPKKNLAPVEEVFTAAAWNYEASIERMKSGIRLYRKASLEVCRELYYARTFLTNQPGQHKDPDAEDYIAYTWTGYCAELGIEVRAANRMGERYVPAVESATGEEYVIEVGKRPALPAPEAYDEHEREQRIAGVVNGGRRPEGWTREEERAVTEIIQNKRFKELTAVYIEKQHDYTPRQDYLKNILAKTKALKQFRLKTEEQFRAQFSMFDAIDSYLKMFPDKETRLAAAANLTAQIHDAVNYLIERDMMMEQNGAEARGAENHG